MKKSLVKFINSFSIVVLVLALIAVTFSISIPQVTAKAWDGVNSTAFASGTGTQSNPYVIKTEAQMGFFLSNLASGVTYEGLYVSLANDLDMTGGTLTAKGTFSGTFDGCGYTITTPFALFYSIGETGTVKRLICEGTETMTRSPLTDYNYGLIESCLVRGTVEDDKEDNGTVGMVCDYNKSSGIVRNCAGVGSVSATGDDCSVEVGMVGWNYGVIEHCYAALTLYGRAPGSYNDVEKNIMYGFGTGTPSDCYYDSTLYTATTSQAIGYSTAEMQTEAFVELMNGSLYTGCVWREDTTGINDGYPVPTACYAGTVSLSYTTEKTATYHTSTLSTKLTASASGTVYYTLDGSNPTTSSTRKTYITGRTLSLSGDVTVRSVLYYGGQYGAVNTQKLIYLPGAGTEGSPYLISNKTQLDAVRMDLTAHYQLENDLTYTDTDFVEGGVASGGWLPIGYGGSDYFTGHFDGQGYAIYGLQGKNGGLFEYNGNDGVIENLRIIDSKVFDNSYCGNVVNRNFGTILRCYSKSAYTLDTLPTPSDSIGQCYAGGIVGYNSGTVQYCRNDGLVYATSTYRYNWLYVGGIAGSGGSGISNCYNTGLVVAKSTTTTEYAYVAGIANGSSIYNCRNDGAFYTAVALDYDQFIGGISASYNSYSNNCVVTNMAHTNDSTGNNRTSRYAWSYYGGEGRYTLDTSPDQALYPELDFNTVWMMTPDGPVPQGVMNEDGSCLTLWEYYAPTCLNAGTLYCYNQFGSSTSFVLPALGHNFGAWEAINGADLHIHTCSRGGCGTYETASHNWEKTAEIAPTCTDDGTVTLTCSDCKAEKTQAGETALGHSYTDYVFNNDATCTANGTETADCVNGCGTKDTREMADSKLEHVPGDWIVDVEPTATTEGSRYKVCINAGCGIELERETIAVTAVASGTCGDNLTWVLDADGVLTISGTGDMEDYSSASETPWYSYQASIESIVIMSGVTSIGDDAFRDCASLTSVVIPDGVTSIGLDAFSGCTALTSVTIPGSVSSVSYAFRGCTGLTSVTISDGVTTIGGSAFYGCTALTSMTIPDSVTCIIQSAFDGCTGLTAISVDEENTFYLSVDGVLFNKAKTELLFYPDGKSGTEYSIPSGVTTVAINAFRGCTSLATLTIPESLTTIGDSAFYGCTALTSVTIPESVTWIDCSAFQGCTALTSVTIPGSVTYVGYEAFSGCTALSEIYFEGDAPAIDDYVFDGVTATCYYPVSNDTWDTIITSNEQYGGTLTWTAYGNIAEGTCGDYLTWTLDPDGVLTISGTGSMAIFHTAAEVPWHDYRTDIKSVVVSDGATTIGYNAFQNCTALTEVTLPEGLTSITAYAFDGCTALTAIDIPDSVTDIGSYAFRNCSVLADLTVSAGLKTLGDYAFYGCTSVTKMIVPDGVTSLGDNVFTQCSALTDVTLSKNLESIGVSAFYGCRALKSIEIPSSVTSIGGRAFQQSGLTAIVIPDGVTVLEGYTFSLCTSLTEVTLSKTLKSIATNAFYCCRALDSITIPASVTSIAKQAFYGCSALTEIYFEGDAPAFDENAFNCVTTTCYYPSGNSTWTDIVTANEQYSGTITWKSYIQVLASGTCGDNLTWVLTTDGVLTISGEGAMERYDSASETPWYSYRASIESLVIESGVTTIGYNAFSRCTALASVAIPNSVTTIDPKAFYACTGLTSVTIPDGVTCLYGDVFNGCTGLTSVTIPDSVIELNQAVFANCTGLTSVTIPDSVAYIGESTFSGCTALTSITFPDSVTYIANDAFGGCTGLTEIYFEGDAPTIESSAFTNVTATVRYPHDNTTWTEAVMQNYGGSLTWKADNIAANGSCGAEGNHMNWTLTSDGVLTIFGTGAMLDYSETNPAPWASYADSITSVVVEEGVANIGAAAFYGCAAMTSVDIPDSVTVIGHSAFASCSQLTEVTIPVTMTEIGESAFLGCSALTSLRFEGTEKQWNTSVSVGEKAFPETVVMSFADCSSHNFVDYKLDTAATCTANATETAECEFCYKTDTREADGTMLEHKYENYASNGDATCIADGTKTASCSYGCGETDTIPDEGSKTDHGWNQWETVTNPTYTEAGLEQRTCTTENCDAFETQIIPATGPALIDAVTIAYDETTRTVILLNVPTDVTVILAYYDGERMVSCDLRSDESSIRTFLLPSGHENYTVRLFFVTQSWQTIAQPRALAGN